MIVTRAGVKPGDVVLEIGAGLGALTIPAAGIAGKVYAVEKDPQIVTLLTRELLAQRLNNVTLINRNILQIDIRELARQHDTRLTVLGNLPYNISSQIIVQLINSRDAVSRAVVMLQKELAQRLTALPGCKDYGRIPVMPNYCCAIRKIATLPAELFFPRPKVASEVIEITFDRIPRHPASDEGLLFRVVKAAFAQRRKTLRNSLSGSGLPIDAATALAILEGAGIDPGRRAETLNIAEFVRLAESAGRFQL